MIPHSYSIVAQQLALAALGLRGTSVFFRECPFFKPDLSAQQGLVSREVEATVEGFGDLSESETPDVFVRIAYPYLISRNLPGKRNVVFMTAEYQRLHERMLHPDSLPLSELPENSLIMTPSEWSKAGIIHAGAPKERVLVVPHGVEPERFQPLPDFERARIRKELGWRNDEFVFLHIGAMTWNKGLSALFPAFARIVAGNPDVRLVLKGIDSVYNSSEGVGAALGEFPESLRKTVLSKLMYIGNIVPQHVAIGLMQAADAYVSAYFAEGFNMPVLEAGACGAPLVCTGGGPTDEFLPAGGFQKVRAQKEVFIAEDGLERCVLQPDGADLCAAMTEVMRNPSVCRETAQKTSKHLRSSCNWKKIAEDFLDFLAENPRS